MPDRLEQRRLLVAVVAVACQTPAAIFVVATIGSQLQPTMFEPAAAFQVTFDWFASLGIAALAVVLLAMPALGTTLAVGLVWTSWRADLALRADLAELAVLLGRFGRRPGFVLGVVAVGFGVGYLTAAAVHALAG